jgi:hypothetical protein
MRLSSGRQRTDTSNRTKDRWSFWKQAILFCSIFRHFSSIRRTGLLYKLRLSLPLNYFLILKSYLHSRHFLIKGESEYTELSSVSAGVLLGIVLGPLLYTLYTAALLISPESVTANFADSTSHEQCAAHKLQANLLSIQNWLKNGEWKLTNPFTTQKGTCPLVHINNVQLPQGKNIKYFGLHLNRRLTWHKHIFVNWKQLGTILTKMYWLLGRKSKLSTSSKLLVYKTILKPIWTYRTQLWGTASTSNIEILECFQPKALYMIVYAPWYVLNTVIWKDLQIPTVKEVCCYSSQYSAHPNDLIVNLMELPEYRRL